MANWTSFRVDPANEPVPPPGSASVFIGQDNKLYVKTDADTLVPVGSGEASQNTVTQNSHGFVAKDAVYLVSAGVYAKARANAANTAVVVGVVDSVTNANEFVLAENGDMLTASFTPGIYFLSDSTAGLLTTTKPTATGTFEVRVVVAATGAAYVALDGPYDNTPIANSDLAPMAANTVKSNLSVGSGVPADNAVATVVQAGLPSGTVGQVLTRTVDGWAAADSVGSGSVAPAAPVVISGNTIDLSTVPHLGTWSKTLSADTVLTLTNLADNVGKKFHGIVTNTTRTLSWANVASLAGVTQTNNATDIYEFVVTNASTVLGYRVAANIATSLAPTFVTAMFMGQSEVVYLLNTDGFYRVVPQPTPGNGNLIVVSSAGAGATNVVTVNSTTVAAGQVNPAMAALSAVLAYAAPGITFVVGGGAVAGTNRASLFDDTNLSRDFTDFEAVANRIEADYGRVDSLVECWYNADASSITNFKSAFWPMYFGSLADGSNFTLGTVHSGDRIDHCLWDAQAATNVKGRGIFARNTTNWQILTPMPFWNMPSSPDPEAASFSQGNPRLSEPARQTILDLATDPIAQSVGIIPGVSAHLCRFGGSSTDIHPDVGTPDGQVLMVMPFAVALLRRAGVVVGEPTVVGIEGPTDGTYADVLVDLPNGGTLTTLRQFRGTPAAGTTTPHRQAVVGFELARGATRRPVFNTAETTYPADFRGTVVIQDTGSGSPRRGRVSVTPTTPFAFGNSLSYLRGQATAGTLQPRDQDSRLYLDMLMEHVPSLYNSGATYPLEGIPVRPFQSNLQVNVPAPPFTPQSTRFTANNAVMSNTSMSFAGSTEGMVSFWLYMDEVTWPSTSTLFNLRAGSSIVLEANTTNSGRITFGVSPRTFTLASNTLSVGRWHHFLLSWREGPPGTGFLQVFVDGVQRNVSPDLTGVSFATNTTLTRCYINTVSGTPPTTTREYAYIYMNLSQALDFTIPANVEKFLLAGQPVNLGGNGELPTGSVPQFFFDGGASLSNLGTAGAVPVAGTLTAGRAPALP